MRISISPLTALTLITLMVLYMGDIWFVAYLEFVGTAVSAPVNCIQHAVTRF